MEGLKPNFEQDDKNEKSPVEALAEFAKTLESAKGMRESDIRLAAQIALKRYQEHADHELDAREAGSPDSELADVLKKTLAARNGIPTGPAL